MQKHFKTSSTATMWLLSILLLSSCGSNIQISDGGLSEGQATFKIETPTATYIYQTEAGGFSSILDANGTDWVQFHKSVKEEYPFSAQADYRGLPNMVYVGDDGGAGHPGFDKMTSEIVAPNQIKSISKSGLWEWTWTFYDTYAELNVLKTEPEAPYWFLYEGPIAGQFAPDTHYWGTNADTEPRTDKADLIKDTRISGSWNLAYFGDANYDRSFWVHQVTPDQVSDLLSYMGSTLDGNTSENGMVVFGFGRKARAVPQLTGLNTFRIGFHKAIRSKEDHEGFLDLTAKRK